MNTTSIRIIAVAATLAAVPLAAQSASARPDPGPPPAAVQDRPDGFDPGWDLYDRQSPTPSGDPTISGDTRRLDQQEPIPGYDPGGYVLEGQVPRQGRPPTTPPGDMDLAAAVEPLPVYDPGGYVFRSQVPRAAWNS